MKTQQIYNMAKYIQIGVTALRAPDGTPLPAVPLYIKVDDDVDEEQMQEPMITDFAGLCAKKYSEYINAKYKEEKNEIK